MSAPVCCHNRRAQQRQPPRRLPLHADPSAMQSPAVAAAESPVPCLVVRLAGEVAEDEVVDKLGLAGMSWLSETGLAAPLSPSPPPPAAAHVAAAQISAADDERFLPRHVVRLAGEVDEHELVDAIGLTALNWLRGEGLLTYPSPLVGGLLQELPEVFAAEVLPWLDPADRAMVAQVAPPWLAAVVASGLPRAGKTAGVPLKLGEFVGSVGRLGVRRVRRAAGLGDGERVPVGREDCMIAARGGHLEALMWAWERGCPFNEETCAAAAAGGHLKVLQWLREHGCPWSEILEGEPDMNCCELAAGGGHLGVLQWLWEYNCPVDEARMCLFAAMGGHREVLTWLRENNCEWNEVTCEGAAHGGQLEVLKWLREHECPWDEGTCAYAAYGGHLELLKWAREHGCPWDDETRDFAFHNGDPEMLVWLDAQDAP